MDLRVTAQVVSGQLNERLGVLSNPLLDDPLKELRQSLDRAQGQARDVVVLAQSLDRLGTMILIVRDEEAPPSPRRLGVAKAGQQDHRVVEPRRIMLVFTLPGEGGLAP
jgi:hypothetical protein